MLVDLRGFGVHCGRVGSLDHLRRWVDLLLDSGSTVAFDVETGYLGPDTPHRSLDQFHPQQFVTGFAFTGDVKLGSRVVPGTDWALYVPLRHDFYRENLDSEKAWSIMKPLLETNPVVAHNVVFESLNLRSLERKGHGPNIYLTPDRFHDTLLQSYVLSQTQYHGLKTLTDVLYNYEQMEIYSLFGRELTKPEQDSIRYNPLSPSDPKVVKYVCDDVAWTFRLDRDRRAEAEKVGNGVSIYRMELEIADILVDIAEVGVSVDWDGISLGLSQFENFYQRAEHYTRKLFEEAVGRDLTTLNFRSTVQVRDLLFDPEKGLGLTPTKMTKKGDNASTEESALNALRNEHPAVEALLMYRQAKKMGEWFQLWSRLCTAEDHKVHPRYKQTVVQSGRFASDQPNVQNIRKDWWFSTVPRDFDVYPNTTEGEAAYRDYVVRHFINGVHYWSGNARDYLIASPGYRMLNFDYSQQELRVLAGLAKEPYLLNAFEQGIDIHIATAALMFGVTPDEVTKDQRQKGKTINFALVYGSSAKGIGDQLGITEEEAQALVDRYFAAFSKVSEWFDRVKSDGRNNGFVTSFMGRKSTIWELHSEFKAVRSKADRLFVNVPVQGGGADITKAAMIRASKLLKAKGWWATKVRLLMNQHDSLVFEVSEDLDLFEVRALLEPCVSFPIPGFPLFAVDWETGYRWGSCKKFTDTIPEVRVPEPEPVAQEPDFRDFGDLRVLFKDRPSPDCAKAVKEVLIRYPGQAKVFFVLDGNCMQTNLCVVPSSALVSELTTVSSGLCTAEFVATEEAAA